MRVSVTFSPSVAALSGALTMFTSPPPAAFKKPFSTARVTGVVSASLTLPLKLMLIHSHRFGAACEAKSPSRSPRSRYGPMIASVFASIFGMFTAFRTAPSSSAARIASAISMPTPSCASAVDAPRCGVSTMFGKSRRMKSAPGGSFS